MKRLDIVIVNWNAGNLLEACIASILAATTSRVVLQSIVVVDNASTDNSIANLSRASLDRVTLISSERNLGFGTACNLGARVCGGDFLLLLNPDTRLFPSTLDDLTQTIEQSPENSAVYGVRLVNELGITARGCARIPTTWTFLAVSLGLVRIFPSSGYVMADWDHETSRFVDHVIGAFYVVRRSVFNELNGFDERFFVYLEDLDLSQRIRERGLSVFYCANVGAFHLGGGTSRAILARRLFYSLSSRLLYVRKHLPPLGGIVVTVATLVVEPLIRLAYALMLANIADAGNVLRAYVMLYRSALRRGSSSIAD